ncbi:MAG: hypothetical protein KAV82_04075, partial [Phycisphaerae bacterium]|nr:hypothetical protein [Phycisphaerae bacterium]
WAALIGSSQSPTPSGCLLRRQPERDGAPADGSPGGSPSQGRRRQWREEGGWNPPYCVGWTPVSYENRGDEQEPQTSWL